MPYNLAMQGAGPLVNRLSRFDKDAYKILQREVRAAANEVKDEAARLLPTGDALSNWGAWSTPTGRNGQVGAVTLIAGTRDLGYDEAKVRGSLKTQVRKTKTGIVGKVILGDAAGAIFSTAGGRTPGSVFNRNLIGKHGSTYPRALGPAWASKGPAAGDRIDRAIEAAAATIA